MTGVKARPALFRALGKNEPPDSICIGGVDYQRIEIFKHDSWAATARYRAGAHEVVCKFNRTQSILGIPMRWLGCALARRESRALRLFHDVDGIPPACGAIDGHPNAVAHDYVDGHPLRSNERVDGDFFPRLRALLEVVHARGMAYVDLHKRENILVGRDGTPYLIDFQVCYTRRFFLRALQRIDLYHLTKHVLRHRPEQVSPLGLAEFQSPPGWIRWHRRFAVPLRSVRRGLLAKLKIRSRGGMATSEVFAEDAVRREMAA